MKKTILSVAIAATLLTSCMSTRTTIGAGPVGKEANTKVYSSVKQSYLLRGTIPLGFNQPTLPTTPDYQVHTCRRFIDCFLTWLTGGIYSQQTVEIITKK
jgi:predicted small secreted protein